MACPVCHERKPRRSCPALGVQICAVCCGTKRETEIHCPSDCQYLAAARTHPAAVVRRRQQVDLSVFLGTLEGLTDAQIRLLSLVLSTVRDFRPDGFARLVDDDVAEAAGAAAATLETAARGVIYEHRPASLAARELARTVSDALARLPGAGQAAFERDAATVLRRVERAARDARAQTEGGATAYLNLLERMMKTAEAETPPEQEAEPASRLIVP